MPAPQLLPVPDGVDLVTAAGLPEVACTVWSNVVMTARLAAGETFLVHGGTGGIGTHAIQVAKALGARVAATAGAPDRLDVCRELGADIAIDYHDDVPAALRRSPTAPTSSSTTWAPKGSPPTSTRWRSTAVW